MKQFFFLAFLSINYLFLSAQWTNQTISIFNLKDLYDINFIDKNTGYVVGSKGLIAKSTDAGVTWTAKASGTLTNSLLSVAFLTKGSGHDSVGYVVGESGTILRTNDYGESWTKYTSGTTNTLLGVCAPHKDTAYVVGFNGKILKTVNGGKNWVSQTSGTTQTLKRVLFFNTTYGFVTGNTGTILRTLDGGTTWTAQTSPYSGYLQGLAFKDANNGVIVSENGKALVTANAGSTWIMKTMATTGSFAAVTYSSSNTVYAIGQNSHLNYSEDNGVTWKQQTPGTGTKTFYDICFTDSLTGYAVGGGGTFITTTNGGQIPTIVTDYSSSGKVNFSPNPAKDYVFLTGEYTGVVNIYDCMGNHVTSVNVNESNGTINVTGLSVGIYYFQLMGENPDTKKIVIIK